MKGASKHWNEVVAAAILLDVKAKISILAGKLHPAEIPEAFKPYQFGALILVPRKTGVGCFVDVL